MAPSFPPEVPYSLALVIAFAGFAVAVLLLPLLLFLLLFLLLLPLLSFSCVVPAAFFCCLCCHQPVRFVCPGPMDVLPPAFGLLSVIWISSFLSTLFPFSVPRPAFPVPFSRRPSLAQPALDPFSFYCRSVCRCCCSACYWCCCSAFLSLAVPDAAVFVFLSVRRFRYSCCLPCSCRCWRRRRYRFNNAHIFILCFIAAFSLSLSPPLPLPAAPALPPAPLAPLSTALFACFPFPASSFYLQASADAGFPFFPYHLKQVFHCRILHFLKSAGEITETSSINTSLLV